MRSKWAILLYGLAISGGANVIFEHALYANNMGVDITFVTLVEKGLEEASWHLGTEKFHYLTIEQASKECFDVAIATEWKSAFDICNITADKYIYFVQSIESRFFYNQKSLLKYIADTTYDMPMAYVTEATWIRDYLEKKYQKNAFVVLNGIDKKLFSTDGETTELRLKEHVRFLVEGTISNWLKNVPRTIELCKEAGAQEIWLVTPEKIDFYPGVDRVFSRVPFDKMPEIYRSCDVIVKLSLVEGMFGPPLEMFHCGGTAITYDINGSEEYLVNEENSIVVCKNDEQSVVEAIKQLANNQEKLNKLKEAAIKTAMDWPDWNQSSAKFFDCIEMLPSITSEERDIIIERGKSGAEAYRQVESLLGMDPYVNRIKKVEEYYKKSNGKLYLYGAGLMCKSSILLLSKYDIPIEGVVVSSLEENSKSVMGHKVQLIDEIMDEKNELIIYITSEKYYSEIHKILHESGFMNII